MSQKAYDTLWVKVGVVWAVPVVACGRKRSVNLRYDTYDRLWPQVYYIEVETAVE